MAVPAADFVARVPGDRRMLDRLRGMPGLDAVVPVVLIAAALVLTLEPSVLGVSVSERQIVLAFFGIDTLVERTGRLHRIERHLKALEGKSSGSPAAGDVLRARSSFERMDALVAQARRSVLIIGVNLEGALGCTTALAALARSGGTVRLLAMDPGGTALGPSAAMSGVDPALRRGKIIQHYLASTPAEMAPLLWLRADCDEPWFNRYLAQCEACAAAARE